MGNPLEAALEQYDHWARQSFHVETPAGDGAVAAHNDRNIKAFDAMMGAVGGMR